MKRRALIKDPKYSSLFTIPPSSMRIYPQHGILLRLLETPIKIECLVSVVLRTAPLRKGVQSRYVTSGEHQT